MTAPAPLDTLLAWLADGHQRLDEAVSGLSRADVAGPSGLPGWTRGHVLTHVARNADALGNLLAWARTGVPTPMYGSPEQRNADIDAGAGRDPDAHRVDLRESAARFAAAAAAMPAERWEFLVGGPGGRELVAADVPWLRVREVWIHVADLAAGVGMADLPAPIAWQVVADVAAKLAPQLDAPVDLHAEGPNDGGFGGVDGLDGSAAGGVGADGRGLGADGLAGSGAEGRGPGGLGAEGRGPGGLGAEGRGLGAEGRGLGAEGHGLGAEGLGRGGLGAGGAGTLRLGPAAGPAVATVAGPVGLLAGWLTGRAGLAGLRVTGTPPPLPRWL